MASSHLAAVRSEVGAPANPRRGLVQLLDDPKMHRAFGAVATKHLPPEKFVRLCLGAIKRTPKLLECDPQSVLGAMMLAGGLGLEPNTPTGQAYLIPYGRRVKQGREWVSVMECQFQIGARGFVTLAYRSPVIQSIEAEAVHEGDHFVHEIGTHGTFAFRKVLKDRGDLIGSFSYVRLKDGGELVCSLPLDEIEKIRDRSETFRSLTNAINFAESAKDRDKAAAKLAETPWMMWLDQMAAKSAIKRHAKQLPLEAGAPLSVAAEVDSGTERGASLRAFSDPDAVRELVDGAPMAIENDGGDAGEEYDEREGRNADEAPPVGTAGNRQAAEASSESPSSEQWEPNEAEAREIAARERAEAAGTEQSQPPAAAPATARTRRPAAGRGASME